MSVGSHPGITLGVDDRAFMEGPTQVAVAVAAAAASVTLLATVHQTPIDAGGGVILLAALALLARTLIRLASTAVEPRDPEQDASAEHEHHGAQG